MAETKQIVKISIDKSRSHTAGIVPYILYNTDDNNIKCVSMGDRSGNWGGFPLDLAVYKETVETGLGGLQVKKRRYMTDGDGARVSSSDNRLRYAELARWYYEIQDMLANGVFTKAVTKCAADESEKITCEQTDDCKYEQSEPTLICDVVLAKYFGRVESIKDELFGNGIPTPNVYAFKPVPSEDFYEDSKGIYKLRYRTVEVEDADEPASYFGEDPEDVGVSLTEGEYYVIIDGYDRYMKYEKAWKDWWDGNGIDSEYMFPVGEGDYAFCRAFEKYFIGKVEVPDEITGVRVPQYVYYADIEAQKDWFEKNGMTDRRSLVGKPNDIIQEFNDRGGLAYYNFLSDLGRHAPWIPVVPKVDDNYKVSYVEPYISLPITLVDTHDYGGNYESYLYSYSEKDNDFYRVDYGFSGYGSSIESWYEPDEDVFVDSQLSAVIDREATEVDGVTGVWGTFDVSGNLSNIFKCTFKDGAEGTGGDRRVENVRVSENRYGHWECSRIQTSQAENMPCADGEYVGNGENKYRTLTLLECIRDVVQLPTVGETYYFLVKKDNCEEVPFSVPYSVNSFHNMTETNDPTVYTGDYVTSIEVTDDTWTIQYVIGGTARSYDSGETFTPVEHTGVKYEEEYSYSPNEMLITSIDGHDNVRVYYNWINIEEGKRDIYSEEYRIHRMGNVAKIIGMEVGSIMTGDSSTMISAMVFTRDGLDTLPSETKNTLDVIIDRGVAAAFETHFKLSECNTFEDLKNYGNNFYNL